MDAFERVPRPAVDADHRVGALHDDEIAIVNDAPHRAVLDAAHGPVDAVVRANGAEMFSGVKRARSAISPCSDASGITGFATDDRIARDEDEALVVGKAMRAFTARGSSSCFPRRQMTIRSSSASANSGLVVDAAVATGFPNGGSENKSAPALGSTA